MKKAISTVLLGVLLSFPSFRQAEAQTGNKGWQLSLGGGFMNYYGDLSPYRIQSWADWEQAFKFFQYNKYYTPEASFGISLEKRFSPGMGLMIQANRGAFAMSDRYRKADGQYDQNAPHWDRALNFKTTVYDAGLGLVFHSDNGRILYRNSFLAPYFFIGAGVTYFKVKGDLYDDEGNPYDYFDPGAHPDGVYETNLRPLLTERDKKYANIVPYADLGLGIKLRFSKVFSITIQSDIKYAFSDYLDDVSGKYKLVYASQEQAYAAHPGTNFSGDLKRGYDDGVNDLYIFNKLSLQFNLGKNIMRQRFKAPIVYNPGLYTLSKSGEVPDNRRDSILARRRADSLMAVQKQDSLSRLPKKDTVKSMNRTDSILYLMERMRIEMQSLRFAHLDQDYVIRLNEVQQKITLLSREKDALQDKSYDSKNDSLQLHKIQQQLDRLRLKKEAIQKARIQLRQQMARIPIITEYTDSTKIMIYKGKKDSLEDSLRLLGSSDYLKDSLFYSSTPVDTVSGQKTLVKTKTDSLQSINDSLKAEGEKTVIRDTLARVARQQYVANLNRIKSDSLRRVELQQLVDSLRREQRIKREQKNTEKPKKNFFQRIFGRDSNNDRTKKTTQDTIEMQQEQLHKNLQEIERLNREMEDLRKNNQWYMRSFSDLESTGRLQERYLKAAIDDLKYSSRRRDSRLEIRPTVSPVIVPRNGGSNNDQMYERQLDDIRRRLDTLQTQKRTILESSKDTAESKAEVLALQRRLDSLQQDRNELESQKDSLLSKLKSQVDSLNNAMESMKKEHTALAQEETTKMIQNFPVISTYFATGSSSLKPEQIEKLQPVTAMVKKNADVHILLKGFTDATGSARVNEAIAKKRCQSVKNILVDKYNLDPARIKIGAVEIGKGRGSNPMHRRVDINLQTN